MHLLFQRSQSKSGQGAAWAGGGNTAINLPVGRPSFKLWAKVELDAEENAVCEHYRFDRYILVDSFQPLLLQTTAYVFGGVFVVAFLVFWAMAGFKAAIWLALLAAAAAAYFYWDKHRETILVSDLLAGRYFSCKSVIDLARREAHLEVMTQFLRQVMESAKHWDGVETVKIDPLPKDEAKRFILRGP